MTKIIKDYSYPVIVDNKDDREKIHELDEFFNLMKIEAENFQKNEKVLLNPKLVKVCDCPICGDSNDNQLFVKWGFIYTECRSCSHIYVKNRLRNYILLNLYSESDADSLNRKIQESEQRKKYWYKVYNKYLSYFRETNINNDNILDVGSGNGLFLVHASENSDYVTHAIDFNEDNYNFLVDLVGKENYYFKQRIEEIDFGDKKFGLITFWGVLEHVTNPIEILQKCYEVLDEDGIVIFLIPNIYSRAFKILGISTPTLSPRAHINFFTEKSFKKLCKQTNLKILEFFQELPVIDLMYPYIDFNSDLIDDILSKKESYYHVYIVGK